MVRTVTTAEPHIQFAFMIEDLHRLLRRRFEKSSNGERLTRAQGRVLASVSLNEGIAQTALAERLDIQKIALTHLVDHLELMGLMVRKVDDKDRRVRRLYVTPEAGPRLEGIWQFLAEVSDEAVSVLPKERAKTFIEDLAQVHEFMKKQQDENGERQK